MDLNRVIGEVAARHGVRLDPDDPALVLVTVTELMLQQAQEEFLASTRRATAEFVEAAGRAQVQAGTVIAESVQQAIAAVLAQFHRTPMTKRVSQDSLVWSPLNRLRVRRILMKGITGVLLFLAGAMVGREM